MTALSSGATRLTRFEVAAASECDVDIRIGVVSPSTWVYASLVSQMVTPVPPLQADTSDDAAASVGADDAPALLVQPQFWMVPRVRLQYLQLLLFTFHGSYPADPCSFLPSCPGEASVHTTTTGTTVSHSPRPHHHPRCHHH